MELNFEKLFANALNELVENYGGSIEETLDAIGVEEDIDRVVVKHWFGWEEESLPQEIIIDFEEQEDCYVDYEYGYEMEEYIANYLSETYGFCVNSFEYILYKDNSYNTKFVKEGKLIYVFRINWDEEE